MSSQEHGTNRDDALERASINDMEPPSVLEAAIAETLDRNESFSNGVALTWTPSGTKIPTIADIVADASDTTNE